MRVRREHSSRWLEPPGFLSPRQAGRQLQAQTLPFLRASWRAGVRPRRKFRLGSRYGRYAQRADIHKITPTSSRRLRNLDRRLAHRYPSPRPRSFYIHHLAQGGRPELRRRLDRSSRHPMTHSTNHSELRSQKSATNATVMLRAAPPSYSTRLARFASAASAVGADPLYQRLT
jgi:hypothetical protein